MLKHILKLILEKEKKAGTAAGAAAAKLTAAAAAARQLQQERTAAEAAEYTAFKDYLNIFDKEEKYNEYLEQHSLKDTLESARAFKEEYKRISNSRVALRHIEANGLQRDFIFFQELAEFKNKSIDEQIALFPAWYDKHGVRKAVF